EVLDTLSAAHATAAGGPGAAAALGIVALRVLVAALRSLQWLHPIFAGLVVAARLALRRGEPVAALLGGSAATMAVSLLKLAGGYPKYHAGVLPLAAAAVGVAAARWLHEAGRTNE